MLKTILNKIEETILENLFKSFLILYVVTVVTFLGVVGFLETGLGKSLIGKGKKSELEIVNGVENENRTEKIQAEISGAVKSPGVFVLSSDSRLINLVDEAGGFSNQASEEWITKNVNLSAKLEDSQKVYIPYIWDTADISAKDRTSNLMALVKPIVSTPIAENSQDIGASGTSENNNLVNVNTASQEDVDNLPGIGPVYASRIIENRPYADLSVFEEVSGVPTGVIDNIKNLISF